jgi:antitoxin VapB
MKWGVLMDTAKIFQNGQSQAIRLPKEYRFRGTKVYIKRIGNAVVLLPEYDSWQPLLESLTMFSDDFLSERNQPPTQAREEFFE